MSFPCTHTGPQLPFSLPSAFSSLVPCKLLKSRDWFCLVLYCSPHVCHTSRLVVKVQCIFASINIFFLIIIDLELIVF